MAHSIYLAASWHARPQMRDLRDQLVAKGYTVTSRWLDTEISDDDPSVLMPHALMDLNDLGRADLVVLYTLVPSTTGGMHVEFGQALANDQAIVRIGPLMNLFQHFVDATFPDAASWLASLPDRSTPLALVENSFR